MEANLNPLQKRCLDFLLAPIRRGLPATYREVADALKLGSVSQAHYLIQELRELGHIAPVEAHATGKKRERARSIRVISDRASDAVALAAAARGGGLQVIAQGRPRGAVWLKDPKEWVTTNLPATCFEPAADFLVEVGEDASHVHRRYMCAGDLVGIARHTAQRFPLRKVIAARKGDLVYIGLGRVDRTRGTPRYFVDTLKATDTVPIQFDLNDLLGVVVGVVRRAVTWAQVYKNDSKEKRAP